MKRIKTFRLQKSAKVQKKGFGGNVKEDILGMLQCIHEWLDVDVPIAQKNFNLQGLYNLISTFAADGKVNN